MEASAILKMVGDAFYNWFFIVDVIGSDDESTMRAVLKLPLIGVWGQVLKTSKGKLDEETPEPYFLAYPSHCVKVVAKQIFYIVNESRAHQCGCIKADALQIKKYWWYMIKNNREKKLKSWVRQVRPPLDTCLIVTEILVQSGASRQEHQKKEIHTTTKTTNSAVNKTTISCKSPEENYFPVSNRQSSKRVTAYFWHTQKRINEQCYSICCAKKQDNGAQLEP